MQVLKHLTFDVGICAYNEAQNIEGLLRACVTSEVRDYHLGDIIVVSSGSNDGTDKIVQGLARQNRRIQLLLEQERTGKSSAINKILERSNSDLIVLISADVLPSKHMINKLLEPFHESKVGMVGCRVSPVNGHDSTCGNIVRFIWSLHDIAADVEPKFGEAVAFRRDLVERLEPNIIADEAFIEMKVRQAGYGLRYAPDALVFNRGPETLFELLEQRKRVYAGHLQLRMKYGYSVSTLKTKNLVRILLMGRERSEPKYVAAAVMIEMLARALGLCSYLAGRSTHVWRMLKSTKRL